MAESGAHRDGDANDALFARLVATCERSVYRAALAITRDAADAEDVAQEAFLRAHRRLASLADPARFEAWVCRIAVRLALNHRRAGARRRRRERDVSRARTPFDRGADPHGAIAARRVWDEIDRLPRRWRVVVVLSCVEGFDRARVAEILRIPEGTVRSRLHAARRRLAERLT